MHGVPSFLQILHVCVYKLRKLLTMCRKVVLQPQLAVTRGSVARYINIRHLSSLRPHHQYRLHHLTQLIRGAVGVTDSKKTFVACSVIGQQRMAGFTSPNEFCATGVNYALHSHLNEGRTLKGILRGCAEQNALGVAAASGHCYSAITDVYLCATCRKSDACDRPSLLHNDSCGGASVTGAVFPCAECWRNLTDVAAMRCEKGVDGPLNLFVLVNSEPAAMQSVASAQKCLLSHPTSAVELTVVLP
ncbi:hypothetical protein TRVL_00586 [Trypanosoma vivax]|nr:hypothetical protein TRVL_00586 [Trypanosoma vivax]